LFFILFWVIKQVFFIHRTMICLQDIKIRKHYKLSFSVQNNSKIILKCYSLIQ
jgi:hypothetical protein